MEQRLAVAEAIGACTRLTGAAPGLAADERRALGLPAGPTVLPPGSLEVLEADLT